MGEQNTLLEKIRAERDAWYAKQGAAAAAPTQKQSDDSVVARLRADWEAEKLRRQEATPQKIQELNTLLNTWGSGYDQVLTDYTSRFQGRTGGYQDSYLSDTASALESFNATKTSLDETQKQIEDILDIYGSYMDKDAVTQLRKQLQEGHIALSQMGKGYSSSTEFFGQFKDEAEYSAWQDKEFRTNADYYQDRLDWYADAQERVKTLTGAEKEALQAEINRYERGEGEWSIYDEETGLQNGFRNLTSDQQLVKLQDKDFVDAARKAAEASNIPSFEDLAEMDKLIFDNNFTMDLGADGQTVAYSSVDGSQLIQDADGNFHHTMEYDPRYTSIDRLGVYLSADSDDKAKATLHGAISTWDNIYAQGISNHWDFLTAEEVSIYYGLKAQSTEEADAYLAQMQSTLNHRYENAEAKNTVEEYEQSGWLHRARMQGRGIIAQGISGIANAIVVAESALTGEEIDAYSATYSGTRYANAVRGAEANRLNKLLPGEFLGMTAGDAYLAFMSAADSAIYNAVPVIGTALTAASGAANDVIDKYAQGASQEQIIRSAATTFAIELATESLGYEKLKLFKEMDVNTWNDWLINVLKQGGTEMLEEGTSYLANNVADIINRRSQSEWSKIWEKNEDDPAAAFGEVFGELLKDGLSGFIAGLLGGSISTVKNTAINTAQTRNIGKAVKAAQGGVEGLKGYASSVAEEGSNKSLSRIASKLADNSSKARVGKVYRMTEASVREQNKTELAKTLQEKGYSEKQAEQIAEAAVSSAAGWRLTEKQQSIWNAAQSDPDVVEAVKQALTGEESGIRRRNQMGEDFRSGVKAGNMANFQTFGNGENGTAAPENGTQAEPESIGQSITRQVLENYGLEATPQSAVQTAPLAQGSLEQTTAGGTEDLTSPEMRDAMQEAYAKGEITEEEYDDYLDALSEQQGMEGVTEEGMRLQEQYEAAQRAQEQAEVARRAQERAEPESVGQSITRQVLENYGLEATPQSAAQKQEIATGASALAMTDNNGGANNGTGVLHGSSQRNDRTSAGEQAGSLAGRAGQDQKRGGTGVDRVRAKIYRQNLKQDLRSEAEVSSRELGVQSGTDNATCKVVPESKWDAGMREADEKAYRETGKHITYVVGPIEVVGENGKVRNARGADTADGLIVRIDHTMDGERIADHEIFHALMDLWDSQTGRRVILDGLMEELGTKYDPEQLDQILSKYKEAMRGIYSEDSDADPGGDVLEDVDYDVLEEMLADAYAGINGHATGIDRAQDTVRQWLRDNHVEQDFFQDNGTEQPTGPPAGQKENTAESGGERYSIETLPNGKKYVRADRQVIFGNDPDSWSEQVEDYINGKIRRGQDVQLLSEDGGVFTITTDTAGKMADNHTSDGRTLDDEKFYVKANAAVHVDELVQISVPSHQRTTTDHGRRHGDFASGGWNYRTAYFRDFDGRYYRLQMSVAKGSKGNVPYNIGDIEERSFPKVTGSSAKGGALNGETSSANNVAQRVAEVKQQIQAVLDRVSINHAAQMERYTELKDSNPELAQKFYDGLMDGYYYKQFEEYLKLTEELERLEKDSSSPVAPQNDSTSGGLVERMSVDDSAADDGERIAPQGHFLGQEPSGATPAAQARNDSESREQSHTDTEAEAKDSYSTLPAKARDFVKRAERTLLEKIGQVLSVPKAARRDFLAQVVRAITNEYLQNGTVSQQTIDGLFQQAYAQGVVADEEYYNQYKHIKDHLRTTAVTLAEQDRSNIADFNDFRRRAGGLLRIKNAGGLPVDTAYMELQDMVPELFPDNITHPADQLVRMYEVAKSIEVTYSNLNQYYGDDAADFKRYARHEFESAIDEVLRDLKMAKRYMDNKDTKIDKAPTTVEEAEEAWRQLKAARRNYEKVMAKNLLTEHDQRIVGDLLYGKATLENLDPERDNVKGITAVYEAKQEYARLAGLLADYKRHLKAELRAEADSLLETANEWKDKKSGLAYSRETMRRNVLDIVKDPEVAEKILRKYFEPVAVAEAAATRFKDKYRERVSKLDLSRKVKNGDTVSEAHAVQLLGEALDNIAIIESARGRLKHRDGKTLTEWKAVVQELWESSPGLDKAKIEKAVQEFRDIYDDLFQQMNEVRVKNGYEPVNYRRGYFPHFQKETTDGILAHFGRALGISTEVTALPTTINGLTHTFRPGIQWFGHAQERLGFNTAYDAVEGFDKYIEGVASVIHQTENIQRLRALASQIRYRTSDEGIRKQVDAVLQDERFTEEEKQAQINSIYEHGRFTLSGFVVELDEYTNLLANKKSRRDREIESDIDRMFYNVMKWLEQRVAANMIAGNLSSALTNFIPLTQAATRMGNRYMLAGMWNTLKAYKVDDGMVETSTFLTNRRGSDPLVQVWQDKVSNIAGLPMEWIDQFVAGSIVRGAYYQNLKRGLTEDEALHQADLFAASVMADRSKGAMPTIFSARNPGTKLFTMFQLEVNNQFSEIFKDIPREMRSKSKLALAAKLLQYFLGAWLFNELFEYLFGRRPALDPIGILNEFVGDLSGYEVPNLLELGVGAITGDVPSFKTEKAGVGDSLINLGESILGELPFSSALGLLGIGEDSRIPVESALPDATKLFSAATNGEWAAEKRWKTAVDELAKPITYLALPFGGNQLSKTVKGIIAAVQGGSYTVDNEGNDILQYPVFTDIGDIIRAAVMGKSSLPEAQDWVDDGFDSLSAKATATYQGILDVGVEDRDAYALVDELRNASKTSSQTKAQVQTAILKDSDISAEGKVVAYCGMVATDTELKWIDRLLKLDPDAQSAFDVAVGLKEADALKGDAVRVARMEAIADTALTEAQKIVAVESFLGTEWQTKTGNPSEYAKFRDALETGLTVDDYMELYAIDANMDKYLEYVDSGLSAYEASNMVRSVTALEPAEGKKSVSNIQKWRAAIDTQDSVEDQLAALSAEMTPSQYNKVSVGNDYGVEPEIYVQLKELLPEYNTDGNNNSSNKEITAAIDALAMKLNLTTQQKAVLWQITANTASAKNNPYSTEIGWKVIDALDKLEEGEADKSLSFGELFTKQLLENW